MYKEMKEKSREVSALLKILSHEKRLGILCLLLEGEKNLFELQNTLDISQSLASQFVLKMKDTGLLESTKRGKEVYYSIKDPKISQLIQSLKNIYC